MHILTNDTAIGLMCCADAFDVMLTKGEMPTGDDRRPAIDAMREAIGALKRAEHRDLGDPINPVRDITQRLGTIREEFTGKLTPAGLAEAFVNEACDALGPHGSTAQEI